MTAELTAAFSQINDCLYVVIILLGALLGAHIIRSLRR